jgi:hypothetical protein
MIQKHNLPPNPKEWNSLPISTQVYIVWQLFKKAHLPVLKTTILKYLIRIDLWLFPPLAFIACYKAVSLLFPSNHPMTYLAIPGTAIMFTAFAMLLLRPPQKRIAHWIKLHDN